jgi:hypothetical protein
MRKNIVGSVGVFAFIMLDILRHGAAVTIAVYAISILVLVWLTRFKPEWFRQDPPAEPVKPSCQERLRAAKQLADADPEGRAYLSDLLRLFPTCDECDFSHIALGCTQTYGEPDKWGRTVWYLKFTGSERMYQAMAGYIPWSQVSV